MMSIYSKLYMFIIKSIISAMFIILPNIAEYKKLGFFFIKQLMQHELL